ncbi:protein eva-1 C, partial [Caerostris darwini]
TWHRTLTPFQSHACDVALHLRCTSSTLISIHYVFYGRLAESGHLCPDRSTAFFSTACGSSKALQVSEWGKKGGLLDLTEKECFWNSVK